MFVIEAPGFRLEDTWRSRQSVLLKRMHVDTGYAYVTQSGGKLLVASQVKSRLLLHCSEEDFFSTWYSYFHLGVDYTHDRSELLVSRPLLNDAVRSAPGVHVLQQQPWDEFLAVRLEQELGWHAACEAADDMCAACFGGFKKKNVPGIGSVKWAPLQTPENTIELLQQEDALWFIDEQLAKLVVSIAEEFMAGSLAKQSSASSMAEWQKKKVRAYSGMEVEDWLEWQEAGIDTPGYVTAMLRWSAANAKLPGMVVKPERHKAKKQRRKVRKK